MYYTTCVENDIAQMPITIRDRPRYAEMTLPCITAPCFSLYTTKKMIRNRKNGEEELGAVT
jgi:hypothetical protein